MFPAKPGHWDFVLPEKPLDQAAANIFEDQQETARCGSRQNVKRPLKIGSGEKKQDVRRWRPAGMLAIALPMVVFQACETVLIFTDRLFLSRLRIGTDERRHGRGLTSFMLMTFFIGLTGYATALSPSTSARAGRVTASWSSQAVFLSFLATP